MKAAKRTATYQSPLRAEQKEATRQRILNAAGRFLEDRRPRRVFVRLDC